MHPRIVEQDVGFGGLDEEFASRLQCAFRRRQAMLPRTRRSAYRSTLIATLLATPLAAGSCASSVQERLNVFFASNPDLANALRAPAGLSAFHPTTQVGGTTASDQVQNPVR
jgi:hypothetical protein